MSAGNNPNMQIINYFTIPGLPAWNWTTNSGTAGGATNPATGQNSLPLFNPLPSDDPTKSSSSHYGIINVVMCDGSVRSVSKSVSATSWWAAATPRSRDVSSNDF